MKKEREESQTTKTDQGAEEKLYGTPCMRN